MDRDRLPRERVAGMNHEDLEPPASLYNPAWPREVVRGIHAADVQAGGRGQGFLAGQAVLPDEDGHGDSHES